MSKAADAVFFKEFFKFPQAMWNGDEIAVDALEFLYQRGGEPDHQGNCMNIEAGSKQCGATLEFIDVIGYGINAMRGLSRYFRIFESLEPKGNYQLAMSDCPAHVFSSGSQRRHNVYFADHAPEFGRRN